MEPGAKAEDFTKSELRQRIDLTATKLGIDFPLEGDLQDANDFEDPEEGVGKGTLNALAEIRSATSETGMSTRKGMNSNHGHREETDMQRKRREKKYEETAQKYEKLGGMMVGPPGTNNGVLDLDIDLGEIQAMAGHGVDTSAEEQKSARDTQGNDACVSVDLAAGESQSLMDGSSVDFDDLSSLVTSLGLPGSVNGIGDSLALSIKKTAQKGRRTQEINKKCHKYDGWARLESALTSNKDKKPGGLPARETMKKQR